MRAERVKLKSCKDDKIITQGKRRAAPELYGGGETSAALGWGPKMQSSPFHGSSRPPAGGPADAIG